MISYTVDFDVDAVLKLLYFLTKNKDRNTDIARDHVTLFQRESSKQLFCKRNGLRHAVSINSVLLVIVDDENACVIQTA